MEKLKRKMQNTGLKNKTNSIDLSVFNFSFSEPFKTEDIANFFAEPYSKPLRAGLKLDSVQIIGCRLSRFFAENREKSSSNQTEKRIYFSLKTHVYNLYPVIRHSCENRNPKLQQFRRFPLARD